MRRQLQAWKKTAGRQALLTAARLHRWRLGRTTFVSVTGSTGKTVTKDLIAAVLATKAPCTASVGNNNLRHHFARTILATRPYHRYCVIETAMSYPGYMAPHVRLIRPRISVVTNIGSDHLKAFGSREAIALEKSVVVSALPSDGVAILNADDPLVVGMADKCRGRVITYGRASDATVRVEDVRSEWPSPLRLNACHGDERIEVEASLHGVHWYAAVLAALAAGVAEGIPLAVAANAIRAAAITPGRLSIEEHPDGVTFIRDDAKAPLPSVQPALDLLASARAERKIAVIGTISDYPGHARRAYVNVARAALDAADMVIFVGQQSSLAMRAKDAGAEERLAAFDTVREVSAFLDRTLRPGDLVLLKGSNLADHLSRLALARLRTVNCWRERCGRNLQCAYCDRLELAPQGVAHSLAGGRAIARKRSVLNLPSAPASTFVVVGLGNPGPEYRRTPHNVGQEVVDRLAARAGAEWVETDTAFVAVAEHTGRITVLVKPKTVVNQTGEALQRLAGDVPIEPERCILVFDDVALPLGTVRLRLRGSSGGHRGVASVLTAFQSVEFARVKLGVSPIDGRKLAVPDLVSPFAAADVPVIDKACDEAAGQVLRFIENAEGEFARVAPRATSPAHH